ncbi:hypothetical protein EJ06DRAFT_348263 [Trichodelitschia bisporula]|uniref:Retrovirus-related Pol polyprotein from transposon TNT 1-94-like beta-barrel domain-containing protein n=1 Tax=Trichodelitschia bisporula TaxID=703511 RepID=A0A6G1I2U4_9PEZI|nr:hypothetical protein EJ06DRAFT_348263 [Trichodelitschia bisporula]
MAPYIVPLRIPKGIIEHSPSVRVTLWTERQWRQWVSSIEATCRTWGLWDYLQGFEAIDESNEEHVSLDHELRVWLMKRLSPQLRSRIGMENFYDIPTAPALFNKIKDEILRRSLNDITRKAAQMNEDRKRKRDKEETDERGNGKKARTEQPQRDRPTGAEASNASFDMAQNLALTVGEGLTKNDWDYGHCTTEHICNRLELFDNYTPALTGIRVTLPLGRFFVAQGFGSVTLTFAGTGRKVTLPNVFYVPESPINEVSSNRVRVHQGIWLNNKDMTFRSMANDAIIGHADVKQGVTVFRLKPHSSQQVEQEPAEESQQHLEQESAEEFEPEIKQEFQGFRRTA